jgi:hypothetical protein
VRQLLEHRGISKLAKVTRNFGPLERFWDFRAGNFIGLHFDLPVRTRYVITEGTRITATL